MTTQHDATLLDILVDGFEKNEVLGGFHWRSLPMPDEASAVAKFDTLAKEAERWKGAPSHREEGNERRLAQWSDLEIRQSGRGIMVLVRAPRFDGWWHKQTTWKDNPMGSLYAWLADHETTRD